jgi:hypothetical protein
MTRRTSKRSEEGSGLVRRLIAVLSTLALALGLTFVVAGAASADITSPANGAVLRGNVTLADSGGYDDSTANHCSWFGGSGGDTRIQLLNSGGGVVFEQFWNTGGARSVDIDTHNYPNGAYTVRGTITIRKNSGFLGLGCSNNTVVTNRSVTIQNISQISYTGSTSGAATTSVPVSAKLIDPNRNPQELGGKVVTFSLSGGTSVNATTNGAGVASASLPVAGPPRNATVSASFGGDAFFTASSTSTGFTVNRQATRTAVDAPAAVVHGQGTSFTARVAATEGTGTPNGGSVQFRVDGTDLGAPVPVSGGVAHSASTSTLSTGGHVITAVYGGDGSFLGSTSAAANQQVDKAQTTTSIAQDVNPTVHGQAVTFTATVGVVAPGAGDPTGSVQFTIDGKPAGTSVPLTGDHASLQVTNLHAGNHDVRATYNGDADFASSDSAQIVHGVDQAQTAVDLESSDTTAVSGQPLTFTAHVHPTGAGAGDPSGTVTFYADGDQIGDPVEVVGGTATSDTAHLLVGTHQITATYSGDDDFAGSSKTLDQAVAPARTTTTVSTSPNPSVFGQPVTAHAEVAVQSPGTGTPTGGVRFTVDGVNKGIVDLVDGAADFPLTGLAVGEHTIRATYASDDENFVAGSNDTTEQTVNKAATSTTVTSSSPTSVWGQPVTFTATVAPVAPGAGSPSGLVSFTDGSRILGTVPVDSSTNEQASITVSDLSIAQHAIVATYTGDGSFLGSDGSVTQKVERARTSTLVTASVNPAKSGQPVSFTATVTPVAPGAGDPTGTVTFTVNGARLGNPVMVSDGKATSDAFATLTPGTYKIAATYSGDGHFVGSAGGLDQGAGLDITKGQTSMTLESSPSPAAFHAPVTFTATVHALAPAVGRPSGVVQFWEGGKLLGASSLATSGEDANTAAATFVTTTLAPGAHAIRAVYVGNFNFDGNSAETSQDVGTAATVTGITAAPNPATYGDDVTLTATVAGAPGSAGAPTGTVTFRDGSTVLGSADLVTVAGSRQATMTVSGLHGGDHALTATYSGDANFAGSTSRAYTLQITKAASSIHAEALATVHDRTLDVRVGIVKATLTGLAGAPLVGESVTFTTTRPIDHAVLQMCSAVTDEHGAASCTTAIQDTLLVALDGGYDVTFDGNGDYQGSSDHGTYFAGE